MRTYARSESRSRPPSLNRAGAIAVFFDLDDAGFAGRATKDAVASCRIFPTTVRLGVFVAAAAACRIFSFFAYRSFLATALRLGFFVMTSITITRITRITRIIRHVVVICVSLLSLSAFFLFLT